MICEDCGAKKENQKYTDVCDACVNKTMKKLWDEHASPSIRGFIEQTKQLDCDAEAK